jgi:eukaryotic-like serine/threonine-protein kinase
MVVRRDVPTPPGQINTNIPQALEKVPEMRFRDGSQLARALEMLGDV